jgi:hypothetical protein
MTTLVNESFALLIGVDDYSAYDPEQNLRGSVNDVAAWQRVCHAIGMKPENVHILGTKTFEDGAVKNERWPNRFGEVSPVREATRENLLAEVKWLADKLSSGGVPGLLTYSGHGDITDEGELALCPSDVKKDGASIANLVTLRELADLLAVGKARDLLTVVFDCCHAGLAAGTPRGGSLALSLRADAKPATGARPTLGARELYSCGPDQVAYQSEFTSQFHGAFTWALTASLLQWKPVAELGAVRLDVSYEDARAVSQKLLGVLNYPNQTAVLNPPSVGAMPFFHPSTAVDGKETTRRPDGERDRIQLDPNYYYAFWSVVEGLDSNGNKTVTKTGLVAQIVVTGANAVSFTTADGKTTLQTLGEPNTEYWFVRQDGLKALYNGDTTNIQMNWSSITENSVPQEDGAPSTTNKTSSATGATWTAVGSSSAPPTLSAGTNGVIKTLKQDTPSHAPQGTTAINAAFSVSYTTTGTPPNTTTTYSLDQVRWYLQGPTAAPRGNTFSPASDSPYGMGSLPSTGPLIWADTF